jgi:hypothetical protein
LTEVVSIFKPKLSRLVLLGIVGLYLVLAYFIAPGADTLWRLHIARGLLDGQVLYRDMIEVNPPLWFWGALPAAALGGYPALVGINLAASLLGASLFCRMANLTASHQVTWAATLGLLAGLLLVSVGEIGQREQAFLLSCALWSALAAARISRKAVPIWLIVLVTAFSAYGFALKHYFVLVPVAIEVLLLWSLGRNWRPIRLETVLLTAFAVLYGIAVVTLTPDFLGRVLSLVQAAYYGFGPWNNVGIFERQIRLLLQCSFVVLPLIAWALTRNKIVLVRILVTAMVASIIVVLMQQKGWRYHLIAANGLSLTVAAAVWRGMDGASDTSITKRLVPLCLAVLAWTSIVQHTIANLKSNGQPLEPILAGIIAKEPRKNHIAILSTAPDNAFFPIARAKREHWSRHYSMWMMPGLLTPQQEVTKEARRLVERNRVLSEFTADLMCTPPDLIVGEVGYFRSQKPILFDAVGFLRERADFAAWIDTYYVKQTDIGHYPIWRLKGPKPSRLFCTNSR